MGSQDLGFGIVRDIIEEEMENIETVTNDVDILPVKELSMTLLILRRLTAASLRTASVVLDNLAKSLEVTEHETETLEASSEVKKEQELFRLENEEITTRHRKDTLDSVDSGFEDDCGFSPGIDPETGLEVISLEEVSYHCTMEDGWMVIFDNGYDATMAFRGVGHSKAALKTLEKFLIGILPPGE